MKGTRINYLCVEVMMRVFPVFPHDGVNIAKVSANACKDTMAGRHLKVFMPSGSLSLSRINIYPTMSMSNARLLSQQNFKVEHDKSKREFYIKLGEDKAVLQYEIINPTTLDLVHTEVPESLRGKGIAQHLAKVR